MKVQSNLKVQMNCKENAETYRVIKAVDKRGFKDAMSGIGFSLEHGDSGSVRHLPA